MGQWRKCLSCINKGKKCQMLLATQNNDTCDKYKINWGTSKYISFEEWLDRKYLTNIYMLEDYKQYDKMFDEYSEEMEEGGYEHD